MLPYKARFLKPYFQPFTWSSSRKPSVVYFLLPFSHAHWNACQSLSGMSYGFPFGAPTFLEICSLSWLSDLLKLVRVTGVEPAWSFDRYPLKVLCIPIPPHSHMKLKMVSLGEVASPLLRPKRIVLSVKHHRLIKLKNGTHAKNWTSVLTFVALRPSVERHGHETKNGLSGEIRTHDF